MRGRIWLRAAAVGLMLSAGLSGCSRWMETGETQRTKIEASKEPETEAPAEQETETEAPKETEAPRIDPFPDQEGRLEPMRGGWRLIQMTDIHYLASSLTDRGAAFQQMVEHGDGKLTNYIWEITDAALEQMEELNPDVLILSGDLTLNGERESHVELAKRLRQVERRGIPVVVIPGNHDINNFQACGFEGEGRYPAAVTSPEEFAELYEEFGYGEASSRDVFSLSYTYDLDPGLRLLMLDSCQYSPRNRVGGMIKPETYEWIAQQLEKAWEDEVVLLPVAHHNLLDESKVYVADCTIEHSEELIDMLESENIPLFLSGHLHVQHYMQNQDIGIYEIVTSSLATPPCQYGVLEYREGDSFSYYTRRTDVERWARAHGNTDENLLNFSAYSSPTLRRIFYNRAYAAMKNSREEETGSIYVKLTEREKEQMAGLYAELGAACYAGKAYEVVERITSNPAWALWQEYCYPIVLYEYMEYIIEDAVRDYNNLTVGRK